MGVLLVVFAAIVCGILMQKKGNYDTKEVGFLFTMLCVILCVILVTIVILCAITVNANTLKTQLEYETLCGYKDNPFAAEAIVNWNGKVAAGRFVHNSWWIGWFEPIDWNNFDFIYPETQKEDI